MKVSSVQNVVMTNANKAVSKCANKKDIAKQTTKTLDFLKAKNETPQPYHIMPELNILGLPKYM